MTPGAVDLKVVGDRLQIVVSCLNDLEGIPHGSIDEFIAESLRAAAADLANDI
jgi:hypothetical protein